MHFYFKEHFDIISLYSILITFYYCQYGTNCHIPCPTSGCMAVNANAPTEGKPNKDASKKDAGCSVSRHSCKLHEIML